MGRDEKGKKRMPRASGRETGRMRKGDVWKSWRREERFEAEMGRRKLGGEKRMKDEA
jgi:hypothetical protein